jgi:hypothetical protein
MDDAVDRVHPDGSLKRRKTQFDREKRFQPNLPRRAIGAAEAGIAKRISADVIACSP